ncbi:hypothetical protein [uncultured Polaribacter sp.]|uniref:hypothetical protein n=1 Tax=uncultured Polaribacter sp. TaxID=174711 RepID=UPI00259B7CD9|nr:hypothetical protein [uncultured Polaribacter sp.]
MKKLVCFFLILIGFFSTKAQEKPIETVNDTVKTEVVEVITAFNPKIADAKKIKITPTIQLPKKSKKKKLEYTIFSAPVASTFIPRSGVVKGIDVGVKERIYKNYLAAGYGNFNSPFFEIFLHHNTRFKNEFGVSAKYLSSIDDINNTILNSDFSNFTFGAFYKKVDRYFDWKISGYSERNTFNWYGLPNINFNQATINSINENQTYNYFKLTGDFKFHDSYIDFSKIAVAYFSDLYKSNEILINFKTKLNFPLDFLSPKLKDIAIYSEFEYLKGNFKNNYNNQEASNYNILTVNVNPEYRIVYNNFLFKIGFKVFASIDTQNSISDFFIFPDIKFQRPVIKDFLNIYGGLSGSLKSNTYKNFTEINPYISPTLFITQTAENSNLFGGLNGLITNSISFNIKASIISEEDKPLLLRNNSKSDGASSIVNGYQLKGYEYGNSFRVYYDDVKTLSFLTEIEYDITKHISITTQAQYYKYTITNAFTEWNLPSLEALMSAKYKTNKWFATADIFYLSERKDAIYNAQYPSSLKGIEIVDSFVDVNLNGGYHFSDKFSAFLKLSNVLNTQYQRFANFNTQGFQILGGITYKFDF